MDDLVCLSHLLPKIGTSQLSVSAAMLTHRDGLLPLAITLPSRS